MQACFLEAPSMVETYQIRPMGIRVIYNSNNTHLIYYYHMKETFPSHKYCFPLLSRNVFLRRNGIAALHADCLVKEIAFQLSQYSLINC